MATHKEYKIGIMETDGKTYVCLPQRFYKSKEDVLAAIERKKEQFEQFGKTDCIGFAVKSRTVTDWEDDFKVEN